MGAKHASARSRSDVEEATFHCFNCNQLSDADKTCCTRVDKLSLSSSTIHDTDEAFQSACFSRRLIALALSSSGKFRGRRVVKAKLFNSRVIKFQVKKKKKENERTGNWNGLH